MAPLPGIQSGIFSRMSAQPATASVKTTANAAALAVLIFALLLMMTPSQMLRRRATPGQVLKYSTPAGERR